MSMQTAFKLFWKRWNDYYGRSTRTEFWKVTLLWIIIFVVFFGGIMYMGRTINPTRFMIVSLIGGFVFWIPAFALIQRRLNDTGMSTKKADILIWAWILLSFLDSIPFMTIISNLCFLTIFVICAFPTDFFINHTKHTEWFR